jgi:hypothetical protein
MTRFDRQKWQKVSLFGAFNEAWQGMLEVLLFLNY